MAIKEIMEVLKLKGRDNFLKLYLNPAITDGFVRMLYPDKPRPPRQKYLLTAKGVMLYNEIMNALGASGKNISWEKLQR